MEGMPVSIAIIDHPDNGITPTYWHARGYGLFAANPLGQAIFQKEKKLPGISNSPKGNQRPSNTVLSSRITVK